MSLPKGRPGFNGLKSFIYDNNLHCLPEKPTHLMLDGGKFVLPRELEHKFALMYGYSAMLLKERHYISENRTPVFRYYIDMDFFEEQEVSWNQLKTYIRSIQQVLKEFIRQPPEVKWTPHDWRVIVLTTEATESIKHGFTGKKTGVHLIWPKIHVDQKMALELRIAILQYLVQKHGKREGNGCNIWVDVIDESVYTGSGLRMVGSRKCEPCTVCHKGKTAYPTSENVPDEAKIDTCDNCEGWGKIDVGRVYAIRDVFDGNGEHVGLRKDYLKLMTNIERYAHIIVKETSIRTHDEIPNVWLITNNFPDWYDPLKRMNNTKERKKETYPFGEYPTRADKEGFKRKEPGDYRKLDPILDRRYDMIVRFIHSVFPDVYRTVSITDILEFDRPGGQSHRYVVKTNERYCMNIQNYHTSNTIYFVILPDGARQKCFSPHINPARGYLDGPCPNYSSGTRGFQNDKLKKRLFGKDISKFHQLDDYNKNVKFKNAKLGQMYFQLNTFITQLKELVDSKEQREDEHNNFTTTGKKKAKRKWAEKQKRSAKIM